ncbi:hypothetical protein V6R21_06610 [Limibacter armeniacum]|uniref:hypothetical protein n=1 Tax=Limibacter armeniacum TaxID=466084 RepID=UPI002FE5A550
MKKLILILAVFLMGSFSAMAQTRGAMSTDQKVDKVMENLSQQINLNEDQKASVKQIYTDMYNEAERLKTSGEQPTGETLEQLKSQTDDKLKEVLTEEQFNQYQQVKEEINPEQGQDNRMDDPQYKDRGEMDKDMQEMEDHMDEEIDEMDEKIDDKIEEGEEQMDDRY